jgi:hypothetical protein
VKVDWGEASAVSLGVKLDRSEVSLVPRGVKLDRSELGLVPPETFSPVQPDEAQSVGDEPRSEGVMPISRTGRSSIGRRWGSFRGRDAHISNRTKLDRLKASLVPRERCPNAQLDEAGSVGDGPRSAGEMPICPTGRKIDRSAMRPVPGGHARISNRTRLIRWETSLVPRETCRVYNRMGLDRSAMRLVPGGQVSHSEPDEGSR